MNVEVQMPADEPPTCLFSAPIWFRCAFNPVAIKLSGLIPVSPSGFPPGGAAGSTGGAVSGAPSSGGAI